MYMYPSILFNAEIPTLSPVICKVLQVLESPLPVDCSRSSPCPIVLASVCPVHVLVSPVLVYITVSNDLKYSKSK